MLPWRANEQFMNGHEQIILREPTEVKSAKQSPGSSLRGYRQNQWVLWETVRQTIFMIDRVKTSVKS